MICEECGQEVNRAEFKAPDGWISAKERIPNVDGQYLVRYKNSTEFGRFKDGFFLRMEFPEVRYPECPYTHWMPLPSPPKEPPK